MRPPSLQDHSRQGRGKGGCDHGCGAPQGKWILGLKLSRGDQSHPGDPEEDPAKAAASERLVG